MLKLNKVLKNSTPGEVAYILRIQRLKGRNLSDVFTTIVVIAIYQLYLKATLLNFHHSTMSL